MTHLLRYLLIFGDRKKKVELTVGKELENVKVETLKQKAKELFNLKNVLLQIWDKGFEDWVDLDEGDPTPTNSRIKVEVDKEAKSLSDINIAKRIPSSSAAVKSPMLVTTPKVDPPFVQVLSSHSSYPPIALTTTEVPIALPAQKSLPALSRLPQSHSQSVLSKQSSGIPQRTLPVGQRQPQQSQAPGHTSSSVGKPILDLEDNRNSRQLTECSRGALWSVTECKYLIGIWCSNEIQVLLGGVTTRRNKPIYKRIALRLADMGFPVRPWDRVRDKVNRVKTEYRKIRRQLANGFGEDQIAFPTWYAEIDAVYGSKLSSDLPDLVDGGDRDDLSSTMLEDRDDGEDRISDDDDNYSADSGQRDADAPSGHSKRTEKLPTEHDKHKNATKDSMEDESGGNMSDGDSGAGTTGEGDDSWIVEGISEVNENESQNDTVDDTTTGKKDCTAKRGVRSRPEANDGERSERANELMEGNSVEGDKEEQNLEGSGAKRYNLRECQVKIEMEDYETF